MDNMLTFERVLRQGVHRGGQGAAARRIEVAQPQLPPDAHQQPVPQPGDLLGPGPAPQIDIGEIILAAQAALPAPAAFPSRRTGTASTTSMT